MQNYRIKPISEKEKNQLVGSQEFKIYNNIWHYSFNDIFARKFYRISDNQGHVNIASKHLDSWSPVLLYSNYAGLPLIKTLNLVMGKYDKKDTSATRVFWYLSLKDVDGFAGFLKRRDENSKNPRTNFPSTKTYYEKVAKVDYKFYIDDKFERQWFIKHYDELRNPAYNSGEAVLDCLSSGMNCLPEKWLRTVRLVHNGEVVAVAVLVDDSKSLCLFNMAAKHSNMGYGVVLVAEIIRYGCSEGYIAFDGGISGKYGIYKDKFFLDSKAVYEGEDIFNSANLLSPTRQYIRNMYHAVKHIYNQLSVKL